MFLAALIALCNATAEFLRWRMDPEREIQSIENKLYEIPLDTPRDVEFAKLLAQRCDRLREQQLALRPTDGTPKAKPVV